MNTVIILLIAGAFGYLVKDLVDDGAIDLPKLTDGRLYLGCIAGMLIGAFIGWVVDQDPVTAGLAGFTGISIIEKLFGVRISGEREK
jgi:hypothetical protein